MVAVLLRLRFRVLANTLARNPFQLVAVIFGGVQALLLVGAVFLGLVIASTAPPAATQAVVVVGGAALVLGWVVVPLLFEGVEQTLDPVRLARFPLRPSRVMAAMFLVGITWVPGLATLIVSMGSAVAWRLHPGATEIAVVAGLVGAATCIVLSRLTTSALGTLLRGRRGTRAGIVVALVLIVGGTASALVAGGAAGGTDLLAVFTGAVEVLGWTPFGAVWSVPGRLAMGDLAGAVGAAVIAVVTLVGAVALWRLSLRARLGAPSGGPSRLAARGRLGPLGWMPPTAAGAVAARSLIYWFRDARHARQLLLIPALPALMLIWWWLIDVDAVAIAAGPVVATLLPLSVFAGLSYDGTAFASELAAGVRGVDDRLGRAAALLLIAAPAVVLVQVVVAFIVGRVDELPALLALSLGMLLVSLGVVSVSSARLVVPVARSGRNPFSAPAGAATTSIAASYAVTGATVVLSAPVAGLAIVALLTGSAALGWGALVLGVVLGAAVAAGGVLLGGRVLDASGPAVLARLRLVRA